MAERHAYLTPLARSGWQPEGQGFESPWVHLPRTDVTDEDGYGTRPSWRDLRPPAPRHLNQQLKGSFRT
jgi:hypothetical protein